MVSLSRYHRVISQTRTSWESGSGPSHAIWFQYYRTWRCLSEPGWLLVKGSVWRPEGLWRQSMSSVDWRGEATPCDPTCLIISGPPVPPPACVSHHWLESDWVTRSPDELTGPPGQGLTTAGESPAPLDRPRESTGRLPVEILWQVIRHQPERKHTHGHHGVVCCHQTNLLPCWPRKQGTIWPDLFQNLTEDEVRCLLL